MNTLLLGTNTWDLMVDIDGNIAMAGNPYSLAQDGASYCRTFLEEVWYNNNLGIDYKKLLGQAPNIPLTKAKMVSQAIQVPEVSSSKVFITGFANRRLTGQIQQTPSDGSASTTAAF